MPEWLRRSSTAVVIEVESRSARGSVIASKASHTGTIREGSGIPRAGPGLLAVRRHDAAHRLVLHVLELR